jgi:hypothetical protein
MTPEQFIALWKDNKLTERGGAQAHFDDLCDLLGVDKPRDTAPVTGQSSPPCMADEIIAANIAAAARNLNELRENWLNPAEWVDWVITPEEEKAGFPKRPVAKPGHEADLKKRTLTNLYNARPAWLDLAHKALDQTVAAAYGWPDYSAETPDDEILRRLLSLNLERSQTRPVE